MGYNRKSYIVGLSKTISQIMFLCVYKMKLLTVNLTPGMQSMDYFKKHLMFFL